MALILLREFSDYRGFRQVNDAVAGRLLEIAEEMAKPGNRLLVDAYCGAGFFAKTACRPIRADHRHRMEHATQSEPRGRRPDHVKFICWGCEAPSGARTGSRSLLRAPRFCLTPRKLVSRRKSLRSIASKQPQRLIYVSCNPATLARDLKNLVRRYFLQRVCPLDMFPQTSEIEVVASWKSYDRFERSLLHV